MTIPSLEAVGKVAPDFLTQAVRDDLRAVEFVIEQEVGSDVCTVETLARHIFAGGGKRLRPAMVSLSARAVGLPYRSTRVHLVGAAMELVHMATLIHDDVVDESRTRRGRPTANSLFGNRASILSGDVLLARAMRLLGVDGDLSLIRTISDAVVAMSEGEVAEVEAIGCLDISPRRRFEIVRKKTAVFMEACCRAGAIIACGSPEIVEKVGEYGHHVGMAFQFADDILDFTGDPVRTGKPIGGDFREGCATLPLIHAWVQATDSERHIIRRMFGKPADEEGIKAVVEMIGRAGGFERTREVAAAHAQSAVASLAPIQPSQARDCLYTIADFVVSRDR
jgi:octaprenyl-diphosphate synthase